MSEWIELNSIPEVRQPMSEAPGLNIEMSVSPYDIPQAVRGFTDTKSGDFVIEFKYSTTEPYELMELDNSIKARVGMNSERIYGLIIDTKKLGASRVGLMLKDGVEKKANDALDIMGEKLPNYSMRYRLNRAAIKNTESRLFKSLVPA